MSLIIDDESRKRLLDDENSQITLKKQKCQTPDLELSIPNENINSSCTIHLKDAEYEWLSNDLLGRLVEYAERAPAICAEEQRIIVTKIFVALQNRLKLKKPECMEIEIFKDNPHYWMSVLAERLEQLNIEKQKIEETISLTQTSLHSDKLKYKFVYDFLNVLFCSGGMTYGTTILSYEYKQYGDILKVVNSMTLMPAEKESPERKSFLRSFFLHSTPKSMIGFIGTHLETTSNSPDVCKPMSPTNTPLDIFLHCLRAKLEYLINTPAFIKRYDTFEFNGQTIKLSENIDEITKKIPVEIDMVTLQKAIYFELTPENNKTAVNVGIYLKKKPITDNLVILSSSSIRLKIFINKKSSATALLRIVLGKEVVFDKTKINPNDIYID